MSDATQDQRPLHKRWRLLIASLVAIVIVALLLFHVISGSGKKRPVMPPQLVSAAKATLGDMPELLNELGTVTPVATVNVLPQLSGYLTDVGYKEGQDVEKGQFLAQIDDRQFQIDKRQAEAQMSKDKATLAQARADLARFTTLNEQKSIAEQTFADQKFAVQQDEAAVKVDEANIAQFDLDIAYCHITAPVAGRVGLRLVDPGNYVTQSTSPGIVTITTMKPTTVQFTVPQNSLANVLKRFGTADTTLTVTAFSSDSSRQIATGKLYALGNQMATATGTVTLRATFDNDDEALYPNEFVNVRLLVDTQKQAVLVPTPAVQSGAPGDFVYLVNADHTVSVHKVTLGPSDGKFTVVASGLTAGQSVVTDGMDRLTDGARVKLAGARPPAGSSTAGVPGRRHAS